MASSRQEVPDEHCPKELRSRLVAGKGANHQSRDDSVVQADSEERNDLGVAIGQ